MGFSSDSKFMVTQTNAPDWMLSFWSWEKGKGILEQESTPSHTPDYIVLAAIKLGNNSNASGKDAAKDQLVGQIRQWFDNHLFKN